MNLGKRFLLQLENDRYLFRRAGQAGATFYFSDLNMQYKFAKEGLILKFIVNNMFDNQEFMSNVVADTDIARVSYRLIPRYVMLKCQFRF